MYKPHHLSTLDLILTNINCSVSARTHLQLKRRHARADQIVIESNLGRDYSLLYCRAPARAGSIRCRWTKTQPGNAGIPWNPMGA